eukprot:gene6619-31194_t
MSNSVCVVTFKLLDAHVEPASVSVRTSIVPLVAGPIPVDWYKQPHAKPQIVWEGSMVTGSIKVLEADEEIEEMEDGTDHESHPLSSPAAIAFNPTFDAITGGSPPATSVGKAKPKLSPLNPGYVLASAGPGGEGGGIAAIAMANDGPAAMRSATLNPNQLAPPPQQGGSSNDARARSLTWDVGDGDGMEVPVARSETTPVMLSTDTAADAEQQVYMWAGNGYATKKREVPGSARSAYFSGYVE